MSPPVGMFRIDGRDERPLRVDGSHTLAEAIGCCGVMLDMRCGGQGLCHGCEVEVDGVVVQACQQVVSGFGVVDVPLRSVLRRDAFTADEFAVPTHRGERPLGRTCDDDPAREPLGLAIDVGTTTVAAMLIDRTTGTIVARAGDLNQQATFGDNVLARIQHAMNDKDTIEQMRHAVVEQTIGRLVGQMLSAAGRGAGEVAVAAIAGNTTMLHLLVGEDPSPLGVAPFRTAFLGHRFEARWRAWAGVEGLCPDVHLLPGVSAYIGADIVAGVDAVDLARSAGPALFLDIGTNGEMVLYDGERMSGCATAAGPAFEGVGLSCGVRASRRAISDVWIDSDPPRAVGATLAEGETEPIGVCGTAYVDVLAEGRSAGLLDEWGRITPGGRTKWAAAIGASGHCGAQVLISPAQGAWVDASRARVTERDIATIIQAKAAIRAGVEVLLERAGRKAGDLLALYVAGGFGTRLNSANAVAIGLLPEIDPHRVVGLGNTSLAGAAACVLDSERLGRMCRLAQQIEPHVLGHGDAFEEHFMNAMRLP